MKLSIFSFLVLSVLGGTLVMAQWLNCGQGHHFSESHSEESHVCDCVEGYAGADPATNCLVTLYDEKANIRSIYGLRTSDSCNTPCDWKQLGDLYANYSCITENTRFCP